MTEAHDRLDFSRVRRQDDGAGRLAKVDEGIGLVGQEVCRVAQKRRGSDEAAERLEEAGIHIG